jgi:hypothetical protein
MPLDGDEACSSVGGEGAHASATPFPTHTRYIRACTCLRIFARARQGQDRRVWEQECNLARRNHPFHVSFKREKKTSSIVLPAASAATLPHPVGFTVWGGRDCGLWLGVWDWELGAGEDLYGSTPFSSASNLSSRCPVPCPRSRQKVMFSRGSNRRAMVGCDVADTSVVLSIFRAGQAERFVVLTRASHTTADRGARLHSLLTGSSPPPKKTVKFVLLAFFLQTASGLRGLGVVDVSPGTLSPEPSGPDLGVRSLLGRPSPRQS